MKKEEKFMHDNEKFIDDIIKVYQKHNKILGIIVSCYACDYNFDICVLKTKKQLMEFKKDVLLFTNLEDK